MTGPGRWEAAARALALVGRCRGAPADAVASAAAGSLSLGALTFAAGKKTAEGFKGGKEGLKNAEEMMKKEKKETDVKEEKPKVAEKFEVGRKKGKGSYDIDYASTVEDAYDELNKIIGSDGIQRLTKDTQGLMNQQLELTKAMKDMGPRVDKIEPMMGQLQSMMAGMKGLTGGKKEGNSNMTDVVGQRKLPQIQGP